MKKRVIWGTGKYAEMFLLAHTGEVFDFFIDNNRAKAGSIFHGKKVYHPDSIESWESLFIYLPYYEYNDIRAQVEDYGLKEGVDFVRMPRTQSADIKVFEKDFERCKNSLKVVTDTLNPKSRRAVFWVYPDFFDRIYDCKYVIEALKKEYDVIMISERLSDRYGHYYNDVKEVTAPLYFDQSLYLHVDNNEFMAEGLHYGNTSYVKHYKDNYEGISEKAAIVSINRAIFYLNDVISKIQPEIIMCFSCVSPPHRLIKEQCFKKGIKTVFIHAGTLAGTINFDIGGEMGESLPAKYPEEFNELKVDSDDLSHAEDVIEYIRESRENRKKQPSKTGVESIRQRIKNNRPVLFFAAQCDAASGLECDEAIRKKYHSPIFESSIEAGNFLAGLAEKNDWNLIYKPHPMYTRGDFESLLPKNVIYIEEGNLHEIIDLSDVVITILSQTAYEALIRNKPVVMLGMMQINKKGCAYEAYNLEDIERTIKEALDKGYTYNQKRAFIKHVAQLLKYYLFSDLKERKISYGKGQIESLDEIYGM